MAVLLYCKCNKASTGLRFTKMFLCSSPTLTEQVEAAPSVNKVKCRTVHHSST